MDTSETNENDLCDDICFSKSPLILLAGDNPQTTRALHRALQEQGFNVEFTPEYASVEELWRERRDSAVPISIPIMVLLEVSAQRSVEAAVDTALRLKRLDSRQFVGYIADPMVRAGGLAGDAIFPRTPGQLAEALRNHLGNET